MSTCRTLTCREHVMSEQGRLERVLQVDTRQLRPASLRSPAWRPPTMANREQGSLLHDLSGTWNPLGAGQWYSCHGGGFDGQSHHVLRFEVENVAFTAGAGQSLHLQGQGGEVIT